MNSKQVLIFFVILYQMLYLINKEKFKYYCVFTKLPNHYHEIKYHITKLPNFSQ